MADIKNNEEHLCDSCCYDYPSCDVSENGVWFGTGKGCDNVCGCNKYEPIVLKEKNQMVGTFKVGNKVIVDHILKDRDRTNIGKILDASVGAKAEIVYIDPLHTAVIVEFDTPVCGYKQLAYNVEEIRRV